MANWTVGRPVASLMYGKTLGFHKFWTVMMDGEPVGPKFEAKAEATYYFEHHYAELEMVPTSSRMICRIWDTGR